MRFTDTVLGRLLTLLLVLTLVVGPAAVSEAWAGPRDAVLATRKADPYASVPTVLDFQRGVYKVNGQRFASFKGINGAGSWLDRDQVDPAGWILTPVGTGTVTNNGGVLTITGDGTNTQNADLSISTVAGRTYEWGFKVANGPVSYRIGTAQGGSTILSPTTSAGNETVAYRFTAGTATTWVRFSKANVAVTTLSQIYIREVVSTPAPDLASPAAWVMSTNGGTATATNSPTGTLNLTGDASFNGGIADQSFSVVPGRTYVLTQTVSGFNVTVRAGNAVGSVALLPDTTLNAGATTANYITATTSTMWVRYRRTNTGTAVVSGISLKEVVPVASVSRASDGYAQRSDGTWVRFGPNEARITDLGLLVEESRTNGIRNSGLQGATASSLPFNWSFGTGANGLTASVVGMGVEFGLPYMDLRWTGTPADSAGANLSFEQNTLNPSAASGQTWTGSFFVRLVGGSATNVSSPGLQIIERDSTGAILTSNLVTFPFSSAFARATGTRTFNQATAAFASVKFNFNTTAGQPIDFTLRFYAPQIEQGAFATSPIITTGAAATRAADAVKLDGLAAPTPYSMAVAWDMPQAAQSTVARFLSFDVGSNLRRLRGGNTTTAVQYTNDSGVLDVNVSTAIGTPVGRGAMSARLDNADSWAALNGATFGAKDTSSTISPLGYLSIGASPSSSEVCNCYIRQVGVWPRLFSDEELKARSLVPLASNDNWPALPAGLAQWEAA